MHDKLYTVDEIAEILRTTPNTIYRWLRAGKLPGVKLGKEWRIKKETLTALLAESNADTKGKQALWEKVDFHHNHVLAITRSQGSLYDLEADFFKKGLEKKYRLFKGCWWQHPDDVRTELSARGLPVAELESNNRLTIVNLTEQYRHFGVHGAVGAWAEEATRTAAMGYKTMWGSGSPDVLSCGGQFAELIEFERTLDQVLNKLPVVGICPYLFLDMTDHHFAQITALMNQHKSIIFNNNGTESLFRNELM
ncbi:MAG: helix-turn-helix domain-containing protein [Firmicutes bacterium]|nr:helix-turn-helix domain-containing protein [Bacillota bacterium]